MNVNSSISRRAIAAGLACALVGSAVDARADDRKEQCVAANEDAQSLRRENKLEAARAKLISCAVSACPGPVRDDCAERLNEVESAIPTVVFTAKQAGDGSPLRAVRVTVDGARLTDQLDGTPLAVDPGEHTFVFVADGHVPVSERLLFREGTKDRHVLVEFLSSIESHPIASKLEVGGGPGESRVRTSTRAQDQPVSNGAPQRLVAVAVGGVGLVGVGIGTYFGFKAKSTYNDASSSWNCPAGPASCNQTGVTEGRRADDQATVATVALLVGGTLLGSGIVIYLAAPRDARRASSITPRLAVAGAGLRLEGAW